MSEIKVERWVTLILDGLAFLFVEDNHEYLLTAHLRELDGLLEDAAAALVEGMVSPPPINDELGRFLLSGVFLCHVMRFYL